MKTPTLLILIAILIIFGIVYHKDYIYRWFESGVVDEGQSQEVIDSGSLVEVITAEVTAYTSSPEETDSEPCISASGVNLCEHYPPDFFNGFSIGGCSFGGYGLIACPTKYPFGTEIEIDGHEVDYVCVDRMASRYANQNRFDIYMGQGEKAKQRAIEWGNKILQIKILK